MTTTPTSGAVDLPDAMRRSTAADGKTELFNLPGYPLMVRAVDFNRIHTESEMRRTALLDEMQKAALAAGQATAAPAGGVVAYLDIGAGGYIDLGSDLSNEAISRLPKGRHALIVAGTYGIDGYTPPPPAQADSVPAVSDLPPLPAPDLRDVGTKPQEIKEFLKGYATEYARTAIAARAPADSVQEDAARYRLLRRCKGQEHEPPFTVQHEIDGTLWGGDLDAAIDAAMADAARAAQKEQPHDPR